ncbi:uncharacterized protein [Panulirus ornatus]|uniref:uncharacterized protein n=1 Tax=Panulirus ornatus TaxID=150431 RepID=UPI003A8A5E97
MLAIVVLAVVATLQVECAPNPFWPGFSHAPAFSQPVKKSHYTYDTIKTQWKPTTYYHSGKVQDPVEIQRAREEFLDTWLQQARLTLDIHSPSTAAETDALVDELALDYLDEEPLLDEVALDAAPADADQPIPDPDYVALEPETTALDQPMDYDPAVDEVAQQPEFSDALPAEADQQPEVVDTLPADAEAQPDYFDPLFVEDEAQARDVVPIADEEEFVAEDLAPTATGAEEVVPEVVEAEAVPTLVEQDTTVVLQPEPEVVPEPIPVIRRQPARRPMRRRKPVVKSFVEYSFEHPTFEPVADYDVRPKETITEPEVPYVEPDVQPFVEPDVQPFVEPDVQPFAEPDVPYTEPDVQPFVEPDVPHTEPDVQTFKEPEVQPYREPTTESIWEVTAETITDPIAEPTTDTVQEHTTETTEPVEEPVEESTTQTNEELPVDPGVDAVTEHIEEPVEDTQTRRTSKPTENPEVESPTRRRRPSSPRNKPSTEDKPQSTRRARPKSAAASSGRSISAARPRTRPAAQRRPAGNRQRNSGASSRPRPPAHRPIYSPFNGEGLDYTLQYFPNHGFSHYYVSTPIGGGRGHY